MKKNVKTIIGIGIFLILIGGVIFSFKDKTNFEEKFETPAAEERLINEATLVIDYGDGNSSALNIEFVEGMTVFDLLDGRAEELILETKSFDMGIFIEAMGNRKNGQDGKYWLYYVNGEMPMVSVDNMKLKPDDRVEFRFEESPF